MRTELTPDMLDRLEDALGGVDLEPGDDNLRTDYSGRGMYGAECVGWVGEDPIRFAFELAVIIARAFVEQEPDLDDIRDALDKIGSPASDSMGRSTIWYWPAVRVTNDRAAVL